ncbi:MAG: phosphoribosyltransferase [Thiohalomonadaceae bacterium]
MAREATTVFASREQAAERIAAQLAHYRGKHALVLAIPRGGVPMGRIVADALEGELDVVLVHKLGAPGNPEYAIGSVDENGTVVLSHGAHILGVDADYVDREAAQQLTRMRERRARYGRPPVNAAGRIAIVVDDGVATGATLIAALRAVRAQKPARLIAGIGVAPPESAERIREEVDELVCLETPIQFFAVSQFFADFAQVSDEEAIALLAREKAP